MSAATAWRGGRVLGLLLVVVVVGLSAVFVARLGTSRPSNPLAPPLKLTFAIDALGAVHVPAVLTPATGRRWDAQALGHADQVSAQFFAWRRTRSGRRDELVAAAGGPNHPSLAAAMGVWIRDVRFESRARDWCFVTYPFNGGSGDKPVSCWDAEVASNRSQWLLDATHLQAGANALGVHLQLTVPTSSRATA